MVNGLTRLLYFFGYLLTTLLIALTLLINVLPFTLGNGGIVDNQVAAFLQVLFILIFAVSIYYVVAGIVEAMSIKRRNGKRTGLATAKQMILRGFAGIVVMCLLYYFMSEIVTLCCGIDYVDLGGSLIKSR